MIVRRLPARAGLMWLRDALALYRRQPFAFTSLVILYTMGMTLLSFVPYIGMPIALTLIPFGTVGLTLAAREAEEGVMPMPTALIAPFRDPDQRKSLTRLGFVNAGLMLLMLSLVSLVAADELDKWNILDGQIDPISASQNFPWDATLLAALIYVPILMVTWLSPQLVAWHGQPVSKALFFSFFACWRNRWPFMVLAATLFALTFGTVLIVTQTLQLFGVSQQLASMLFAPVLLILISIGYATQYPIYRSLIESSDSELLPD